MARNVSKKRRFDVFKRDAFTCQYCGLTPPAVVLECDHVIPVVSGGDNEMINLITACFDCNRGKRDGDLQAVPAKTEELIRIERERAEQVQLYNAMLADMRVREEADIERLGVIFNDWFATKENKGKYTFGGPWRVSIRTFLRRLPAAEIEDAIEIACSRKGTIDAAWSYLCGICWNKIKQRGN